MRIVNFAATAVNYELEPEAALDFFKQKGLKTSFAWQDMIGAEHDSAFTVAKMMNADLLATVQDKMKQAIASGTTFQQFTDDLVPQLQKAGWWGKRDLIDPATGHIIQDVQLGSLSRLDNIFRTNMQSAYSVGQWDKITEQAARMPYLMYDAVDDNRTRDEHEKLDGQIHPVTAVFWKIYFPPNGWRCRCGAIQMDDDDLAEYGLTISELEPIDTYLWTNPRTGEEVRVPVGIDAGWDHSPGQARYPLLDNLLTEKKTAVKATSEGIAAEAAQYTEAEALELLQAEYPNIKLDRNKAKRYDSMSTLVLNTLVELTDQYKIDIDNSKWTRITIANKELNKRIETSTRGMVSTYGNFSQPQINHNRISAKTFFINSAEPRSKSHNPLFTVKADVPQRKRTTVHEFGHLIWTPGIDAHYGAYNDYLAILETSEYKRWRALETEYKQHRSRLRTDPRFERLVGDYKARKFGEAELRARRDELAATRQREFLDQHPDGNLFISEYAWTDDDELFAEAFADYYLNESENPLVKMIGKLLDEHFKH